MSIKELGTRIKVRRKELGITQAYLAAISGTGIRFIIELEQGKPTVQLNKVLDVLSALNLTMNIEGPNE